MLSGPQQRKIISQEPEFVEKLQRMEALGMQLGKLLGQSILTLGCSFSATGPEGKSLGHSSKDGKWFLMVDWNNSSRGYDDVIGAMLEERVKGWIRHKKRVSLQYRRHYNPGAHTATRNLSIFNDSVVAVLDGLSDELEEQITRASRVMEEQREQSRSVVEEHPREKRNRFDQIDPLP